jgi:hypothetical protein
MIDMVEMIAYALFGYPACEQKCGGLRIRIRLSVNCFASIGG